MGCCASSSSSASSKEEEDAVASDSVVGTKQQSQSPPNNDTNNTAPHVSGPNNEKHTDKDKTSRDDSADTELSWNLDADLPDDRKAEFKLKISQRQSEIEEEKQRLASLKATAFANQVLKQKKFKGLYDVFKEYAINADKSKLDIDGLTAALKEFGMTIDTKRDLQKFVWSKFDIDNEQEIDYNDFMATMSSLIGTKNEDALLLMFQIFDLDEDGYLNTEDMAMIILSQNQIALAVTGHVADANTNSAINLTKKTCLKLARKIITKLGNNFNDSKISFDDYKAMMMKTTTEEMMISTLEVLPSLDSIATPSGCSQSADSSNVNNAYAATNN